MSAPEAPRSTRNKPSLKCANEELITMNALGNRKTRKINSATSTPMPNVKAITPESTPWYKKSPQLTSRLELLPHRVWSFSIHARLMIEKQQAQEQRDLTVISSPTGSEENDELFRRICTYESQGSTNPVSITLSASPTTRSSTCDDVYHQRQAIGGPEASYRPNWVRIWSVSLQYQHSLQRQTSFT